MGAYSWLKERDMDISPSAVPSCWDYQLISNQLRCILLSAIGKRINSIVSHGTLSALPTLCEPLVVKGER